MDVPAFCDNCGAIFRSGIVVEKAASGTSPENPAGPCPACSGEGHIPAGLFGFVGNTIEILAAPQVTIDELSRLAEILYAARAEKQNPDHVADVIRKEVPALSGLAEILPKTHSELDEFITFIAAVISLSMQVKQGLDDATSVTVERAVNEVFIEADRVAKAKQQSVQQGARNVRRNDPCPCGSGKKYKKCCGTIQ